MIAVIAQFILVYHPGCHVVRSCAVSFTQNMDVAHKIYIYSTCHVLVSHALKQSFWNLMLFLLHHQSSVSKVYIEIGAETCQCPKKCIEIAETLGFSICCHEKMGRSWLNIQRKHLPVWMYALVKYIYILVIFVWLGGSSNSYFSRDPFCTCQCPK